VLFIANKILRFGSITLNRKNLNQSVLLVIYAVILFALPEEIIFRGVIQSWLQEMMSNPYMVIFLSSTIYGLAHALNGSGHIFHRQKWNWSMTGMTFIAGLFLGYLYFITDSLVLPIILHVLLIIADQLFIKGQRVDL
jgi:uncharacterized protein